MSDSVPPIELPACELGRLEEISELVSSLLFSILSLCQSQDSTIKILQIYSIHTYHDTFIG